MNVERRYGRKKRRRMKGEKIGRREARKEEGRRNGEETHDQNKVRTDVAERRKEKDVRR